MEAPSIACRSTASRATSTPSCHQDSVTRSTGMAGRAAPRAAPDPPSGRGCGSAHRTRRARRLRPRPAARAGETPASPAPPPALRRPPRRCGARPGVPAGRILARRIMRVEARGDAQQHVAAMDEEQPGIEPPLVPLQPDIEAGPRVAAAALVARKSPEYSSFSRSPSMPGTAASAPPNIATRSPRNQAVGSGRPPCPTSRGRCAKASAPMASGLSRSPPLPSRPQPIPKVRSTAPMRREATRYSPA